MEIIVFIQVIIIFILMSVGFVLSKLKIIDEKGTGQMTEILLNVVTPCVLINAYQREFDSSLVGGLLYAGLYSLLIHVVAILICTLMYRRKETRKINIFASIYSNCGFMAIPLLSAAMGADGVFFGSAYLAVFTLLYWTHGVCVYSGSIKEISPKKIITNPGIIGTVIAIILFVCRITLPGVIRESVSYIAALNTPLAMIVMGAYLTRINFKKALKNISIYIVSAMRLIVIPVVAIAIAKVLGFEGDFVKAVLISAACPTAAVAALLAVRYNLDAPYATEIVSVSTIFSVVTIPLILILL